jgi:hypothetical protein
MLNM